MGKFAIKPVVKTISEADAISQFVPFLEQYGIDLDKAGEKFTATDKVGTVTGDDIGESYVEKICSGELSFEKQASGDIFIMQYLKQPTGETQEVQYGKLLGRHRKYLAGKDNTVEKSYAFLAGLSGKTAAFFENMSAYDSSIALEVAGLFQMA